MDNQTAIGLLTLCGIVAVLILLGSFLVIRILKGSIFGIGNMVLRSVTDPPEVKAILAEHPHPSELHQRRDLRAEAKSVDFDAAVASRKGEVAPSVRTNPTNQPPELNASAFSTPTPPAAGFKRRKTRPVNSEDDDDGEMFEGLLGE